MTNVYHVLYEEPKIEPWGLTKTQEELARQLVKSGQMRIDTGDACNFVRFSYPHDNIYTTFTVRELNEKHLVKETEKLLRNYFAAHFSGEALNKRVTKEFERLHKQMGQNVAISEEKELVLARALVQATEPVVIGLILAEYVDVFISFSHSIGDLMDIKGWQTSGKNSGMQSNWGEVCSIYVSCGGDPFKSPEISRYTWDGYRAMARLMVIAGQEIGHYADILRDSKGKNVSRHSSDAWISKPTEKCRIARKNDIKRLAQIEATLLKSGLKKLAREEKNFSFYKKHKRRLAQLNSYRKMNNLKRRFIRRCRWRRMGFVASLGHQTYMGRRLLVALRDMYSNLDPNAEVYRHEDPQVEEAIACAESLARVPQQAVKWGHAVTRVMMSDLYKIYYSEVIPNAHRGFLAITGKKFRNNKRILKKPTWRWFVGLFKKRRFSLQAVEVD